MRLSHITLDERFQLRTALDGELVRTYADAMTQGDTFPALTVGLLDGDLVLLDGWHRYHAMLDVYGPGHDVTLENVGAIDEQQALDVAIARNRTHGARWNAGDRRRAAMLLLAHQPALSSREVARRVGVSPSSVEAWRGDSTLRVVQRGGDSYALRLNTHRAKSVLHDDARAAVERHGVDDAATVAVLVKLAQDKSSLMDEIIAAGGVYANDSFTALSDGADALQAAIESRRKEARAMAMQSRTLDTRIIRIQAGAVLDDDVRAVVLVERDSVGKAYAWLRGASAYLCDMVHADNGASWWCIIKGRGAWFVYEQFAKQQEGADDATAQ